MPIKEVSIDHLSIGMYVVGVDKECLSDGRYTNTHLIQSAAQIEYLKANDVHFVIIDPTLGKDVDERVSSERIDPLSQDLSIARMVRQEAVTALQDVFEDAKMGSSVNTVAVQKIVSSLMHTLLHQHDVLLSLIHLQRNVTSMLGHAVNVCAFSLVIGKSQGYTNSQLEKLGVGALLHDIGELRLPRNLFLNQEIYDNHERRLLQQHPQLGVTILSASDAFHEDSLKIVSEHHERIDGSGYPAGLIGADISPFSQIVGIVDMYDAMLSSREGRPPLQPTQAIKELYQLSLKGLIDRHWAERTIRCLGIYPVGSLVELNSGEIAVVLATNSNDALRPKVRIIGDISPLSQASTRDLDLAGAATHESQTVILRVLEPNELDLEVETYLA